MENRVQCPACKKSIVPIKARIKKKDILLKSRVALVVTMVIGLLVAISGLAIFIKSGLSSLGWIGIIIAVLGSLFSIGLFIRHVRGREFEENSQECPLCGHQWIEQGNQVNDPDGLEQFFTDFESQRAIFEQLISETHLSKNILIIHGIGGVGKSTLLKMYQLSCRRRNIPVALASGDETPSSIDVLVNWVGDLSRDSITLQTFQKTLSRYRTIQAKVEAEAKKTSSISSMGKASVGMVTESIPLIGSLVGTIGSESTEFFIDWLHGFLSSSDLEFYLNPAERLDSDFLSDLGHASSKQRIVLLMDTYERMNALNSWMGNLAQRLPENVLLVIAGRSIPDWNRTWTGWIAIAIIVELLGMAPDTLRELVGRYHALIRAGDPDPEQVEAIVQFARRLPLVATTVVQLWTRYGIEDFQTYDHKYLPIS
jgi:hypothetical protein